MTEPIPTTNEELMREFFDTNSLVEHIPPEEWMAAETEDDDQEPEQADEPDSGDGISDAERAFIGAAEVQVRGYRRRDGTIVKPYLRNIAPSFTDESRAAVEKAFAAIDKLVSVSEWPDIEELDSGDAATARMRQANRSIAMHPDSKTSPLDVVHEMGHYLDMVLTDEDREEVYTAAHKTPFVQGLLAGDHPLLTKDEAMKIANGRELLARAFEQWVALKSGDPEIEETFRKRRDRYNTGLFWPDEEWPQVEAALEGWLSRHGFLRGLDPQEKAVLTRWRAASHGSIVKGYGEDGRPESDEAKLFDRAVRKLPPESGVVYRGINMRVKDQDGYDVRDPDEVADALRAQFASEPVQWNRPVSASMSAAAMEKLSLGRNARVVFRITSDRLRNVNPYGFDREAWEAERVLLPGQYELDSVTVEEFKVTDPFAKEYGGNIRIAVVNLIDNNEAHFAEEFREHLHPRGRDGKFIKKFKLPKAATRVRTRYASWTEDDWETGWVVGTYGEGDQKMISVLYPGQGVMNRPVVDIESGKLLMESLTDGPVYLSDIAVIYRTKLAPWEPRPRMPDREIPDVPDDFWAKGVRKRMRGRNFPSLPRMDGQKPMAMDDYEEVLKDPSSYQFQWLKQTRSPFFREVQDEIMQDWAAEWEIQTFGLKGINGEDGQYRREGEMVTAAKPLPDVTREISAQVYDYLWQTFIDARDIRKPENRAKPDSPDHPWFGLVGEEFDMQRTRDKLGEDAASNGWGNLVDSSVPAEMREELAYTLKPLMTSETARSDFPGRWLMTWDRSSWDDNEKRFTRIVFKQSEPHMVAAQKYVDRGGDPDKYWYERKQGMTRTLDVVPSKVAIEQEATTTEFGRIALGVLEDYINDEDGSRQVRAQIEAYEREAASAHETLLLKKEEVRLAKIRLNEIRMEMLGALANNHYQTKPAMWRYNNPPDSLDAEQLLSLVADFPEADRKEIQRGLIEVTAWRSAQAAELDDRHGITELQRRIVKIVDQREEEIWRLDKIKRRAYAKMMREQFDMDLGVVQGGSRDPDWPLDMAGERPEDISPSSDGWVHVQTRRKLAVQNAAKALPARWIEASNSAGSVTMLASPGTGGQYDTRGYHRWNFGSSEIWLAEDERMEHVAVHELAHRMERVIPGLTAMEAAFHYRRTRGDEPKNYQLSADEWVKRDRFVNEYSGKMYDGDSWEVFTMSLQALYPYRSNEEDYRQWSVDPENLAFALGVLTLR